MTKRVLKIKGGRHCELCGKEAETRPYGPHGKSICFPCMKKDEGGAKKRFGALMKDQDVTIIEGGDKKDKGTKA